MASSLYNFTPLDDLVSKIEIDIKRISEEYSKRLQLLQKQQEEKEIARQAEEEKRVREAEEQRKENEEQERVRKANKQIEADRVAALEEADRKAKKEEEDRLAAVKEETDRLAAVQAETDRLATVKAETDRVAALQKTITEAKAKFTISVEKLKSLKIPTTNAENFKQKAQDINTFFSSMDTNTTIEDLTKYNTNIETLIIDIDTAIGEIKTIKDIIDSPDYKVLLVDIMFLMNSYESKDESQRKAIYELISTISEDKIMFDLVKQIYDNLKNISPNFIEYFNNQETIIENYSEIMTFIKNNVNTTTNTTKLKGKFSGLYEIVVGTARVTGRGKPKTDDNTAPEISKDSKDAYTFRNYFDNLPTSGGALIQQGGYDYNQIIKAEQDNKLQIGEFCKSATGEAEIYGPFYSIYPPQYNNFHIYYNMFGLKKLSEIGRENTSDETLKINKYDSLLTKLPSLNGERHFDTSQLNNIPHGLMKKLANGGSVVLFGYGFSGSGKTYALIAGSESPGKVDSSKIKYDPSILEQFIKDNSDNIEGVEFVEIYPLGIDNNPDMTLSTNTNKVIDETKNRELVTLPVLQSYASQQGLANLDSPTHYDTCKEGNDYNLYKKIEKGTSLTLYNRISTRFKLLERHRISKLRILATPNNNESSRSFFQITLNLKVGDKKSKLVIFDMPGTENTVRIKTQFIDEQIFDTLKILDKTKLVHKPIPVPTLSFYNKLIYNNIYSYSFDYIDYKFPDFIKNYIESYKNQLQLKNGVNLEFTNFPSQILSITKINNVNGADAEKPNVDTDAGRLTVLFKNFILQKVCFEVIGINITNDEVISNVSLDLALFINGHDLQKQKTTVLTFNQLPNNTTLFFLRDESFKKIVIDFITLFLNSKDDKNVSKYYSVNESNKHCKIPKNLEIDDIANLQNIFSIVFSDDTNNNMGFTQTDFTSTLFDFNKTSNLNLFDYGKESLTVTISHNKGSITEIKDKNNLNSNFINSNIYFANPLIKYIYLILSYLYKKTLYFCFNISIKLSKSNKAYNTQGFEVDAIRFEQLFYRSATLFIYKYINFIVEQGRSIVTNLEHLKFFFLTRTGLIDKYNQNAEAAAKAAKTTKTTASIETRIDKSFLFTNENSILDKRVEYVNPTLVGKQTSLYIRERINIGNMISYCLINILQELSQSNSIENCLITEVEIGKQEEIQPETNSHSTQATRKSVKSLTLPLVPNIITRKKSLNLLKAKQEQSTDTTIKKQALLGAIFVMFTNFKIFLDTADDAKKTKEELEKPLRTLCDAAKDTAKFAQSISSTSINSANSEPTKAVATVATGIVTGTFGEFLNTATVGGKRKFNINQLINHINHNNNKHRTRRNISYKNKKDKNNKNRVFYNRTKKNM